MGRVVLDAHKGSSSGSTSQWRTSRNLFVGVIRIVVAEPEEWSGRCTLIFNALVRNAD